MKLIYSLSFFCLLSFNMFSQEEKILKEADKKFKNFAYVDAREIYLDVAKSGYKSENLFKKLGDSYYFNNELQKSLEWYEKLYDFQKNIEPIYLFRYSMALKSAKKYKEADEVLVEYYKSLPQSEVANLEMNKIDPNNLININSNKYTVEKTNINSAFSDYAPTYYLSKLVFVSNRKTKDGSNQKKHKWNNQPFSDLYSVNIKKGNELDSDIQPFSDKINSPYHESSAVFTKDGKTIYFSRNNFNEDKFKTNSKGINLVKIYKSTKNEDETWGNPVELPFNSDEYSCAHPALSPDEKKLFFSSDMPGTKGMSDIYVTEIYSDGSFGTPINLGGKINTVGRESYPFVSKKNQLFFASDGHYGLGGFDIFITDFVGEYEVGEIINLGSPINSSLDDFSLIIDTDDNTGFYTTNKNDGAGSDEIYSFKLINDFVSNCKQYVNGYIKSTNTNLPIKNCKVEAYDLAMKLVKSTYTNNDGYYSFEMECNKKFVIRATGDGIQTSENVIATDDGYEKKMTSNLKVNEGFDLGKSKTKYGDDISKNLQLDPIYFDFDKNNIRPDAEVELQKIIAFLNKFPDTYIDVRSHTDSQGSSDYNLNLSNLRAKSTIEYIIKYGISRNRITGRGYGDTQLINNCYHGEICSEELHQLNRRSEFILQENSNKNKTNNNLSAKGQDLENKNSLVTTTNQQETIYLPTDNSTKSGSASKSNYDFSSSDKMYTVQIAAASNPEKAIYSTDTNVFYHRYSDGFTRFFNGTFKTLQEAKNHKQSLLEKGYTNAFIVLLKGEERLKAQ